MPTFQELKAMTDGDLLALVPELTVTGKGGTLRVISHATLDESYRDTLNVFAESYQVNGIAYKMTVSCVLDQDGVWQTRSGNTYIRRADDVFVSPTPAGYDGCHAAAVWACQTFAAKFPDWRPVCLLVATEQSRRSKLARAVALRKEADDLEREATHEVAAEVGRLCMVVWPGQVTKSRPAVWRPKGAK